MIGPRPIAVCVLALMSTGAPAQAQSPAPPGLITRGVVQDDLFRLTIETPRTTYTVGDPIPIVTILAYTGSEPSATVTHAHGGVVAFGVEQLDGPLDAGPFRRMSCSPQTFVAGEVERVPFAKSGAYSHDDPLAPMWDAWLHDPLVRPPVGTFRIDAVAEYGPAGCAPSTTLTASVTVQVIDDPEASPTPQLPADAPPEAVLEAYLAARGSSA